jgi:hypothetical protein
MEASLAAHKAELIDQARRWCEVTEQSAGGSEGGRNAEVRVRDGTCRFPGCSRAARQCELDHTRDWQHGGETAHNNLAHFCPAHHRLKHQTGWPVEQASERTLKWISPSGRTYVTELGSRLIGHAVKRHTPHYGSTVDESRRSLDRSPACHETEQTSGRSVAGSFLDIHVDALRQ